MRFCARGKGQYRKGGRFSHNVACRPPPCTTLVSTHLSFASSTCTTHFAGFAAIVRKSGPSLTAGMNDDKVTPHTSAYNYLVSHLARGPLQHEPRADADETLL